MLHLSAVPKWWRTENGGSSRKARLRRRDQRAHHAGLGGGDPSASDPAHANRKCPPAPLSDPLPRRAQPPPRRLGRRRPQAQVWRTLSVEFRRTGMARDEGEIPDAPVGAKAGLWESAVHLPAAELQAKVDLLQDSGALRGTIDSPQQNAKELALGQIAAPAGADPGIFLDASGAVISGHGVPPTSHYACAAPEDAHGRAQSAL